MAEADPKWLELQKKIYGRFIEQRINTLAEGEKVEVKDILADLSDGTLLVKLCEVLSGTSWTGTALKKGLSRIVAMDQLNNITKWMEDTLKVDMKRCTGQDILDKNDKAVFGLLFSIIVKFVKLDDAEEDTVDVREALLLWFKNKTASHNVVVENLKGSFTDGAVLCALIHKLREKVINWDDISPGKDNSEKNLTIALKCGSEYFGVPEYLTPEDIGQLDAISMTIYLFDWYFGAVLLQKQDVAARRIGKLIDLTIQHDGMKVDYLAGVESIRAWVVEKSAWLSGIAFDNTLQGIKDLIELLIAYKSKDKSEKVAESLDVNTIYQNLAVSLKAASRPVFEPAGSLPADVETLFSDLDKVEAETGTRMMQELAKQLEFEKQNKRLSADIKRLKEGWLQEQEQYCSIIETCSLLDEAKENLYQHEMREKDVKNVRLTRLADIQEVGQKLVEANFEKKDEVSASTKEIEDLFSAMEGASQSKLEALKAAVVEEEAKDDAACKSFADLVHDFSGICSTKKSELISSEGELADQLTAIEAQIAAKGELDAKIDAITAAQEAISERNITTNPHTTVSAYDCEAQNAQLAILLEKKKELLVKQLSEKESGGMDAESLKEINDNFSYFDKDNGGSIGKKELRGCLQSLGESTTAVDIAKILEQYDTDKSGALTLDEFTSFMKDRMGDTNTAEEILEGWGFITYYSDAPKASIKTLEILVNDVAWKTSHVEYLKTIQKDADCGEEGLDFATWTAAVFKR